MAETKTPAELKEEEYVTKCKEDLEKAHVAGLERLETCGGIDFQDGKSSFCKVKLTRNTGKYRVHYWPDLSGGLLCFTCKEKHLVKYADRRELPHGWLSVPITIWKAPEDKS